MINDFWGEVGIGFLGLLMVRVEFIRLLNYMVVILFVKGLFCKFRGCKLWNMKMEVGVLYIKLLNFILN